MSDFSDLEPILPGEELRAALAGYDLTQEAIAEAMGISRVRLNSVLNGRRALTAETALKLARILDTTPEFWLNLQRDVDLYNARRKLGADLAKLPILREAVIPAFARSQSEP